jgi:flotillin
MLWHDNHIVDLMMMAVCGYRLETLAEANSKKIILQAQAEAEAIRLKGEAESFAIASKAKAEAEQMSKKAEAYKEYTEAAMVDMLMASLPKVQSSPAEL